MSKPLEVVRAPDMTEVMTRYSTLQSQAREAAEMAWVGTLVTRFTNDELRLLADYWSIGETYAMRRLGLLSPDEGYDGKKRPTPRKGRR